MIEARIGSNGSTAPFLEATSRDDKLAMLDRWLAEHPNDVSYLEVKRDDPRTWQARWDAWDEPRDFMRVGVTGAWAAAEFVRNGTARTAGVIHATFNRQPSEAAPPVPYGQGRLFPADTVVPLSQVRQLMIDYVMTGEWSHAALWRNHDAMVA